MNWQEVCSHPYLKDLSFKLETDRWGYSFPARMSLPFD